MYEMFYLIVLLVLLLVLIGLQCVQDEVDQVPALDLLLLPQGHGLADNVGEEHHRLLRISEKGRLFVIVCRQYKMGRALVKLTPSKSSNLSALDTEGAIMEIMTLIICLRLPLSPPVAWRT